MLFLSETFALEDGADGDGGRRDLARGRAQRPVPRRADRRAADRGRRGLRHSGAGSSAGIHRRKRHGQRGYQWRSRGLCPGLYNARATPRAVRQPRRRERSCGSRCAAALRTVDWTLLGALAISAVVFAVTIPLSWRYRSATRPVRFVRTRFDIPLRALTVAVVVAVVTDGEFQHRLIRFWHVRAVSDHPRQLDRHHASAHRRQRPRPA